MANFQEGGNRSGGFRGGSSGGKPNFQKKSWGGDRGGEREVIMHNATCSECGKSCQVPFRPSGDKPVYCNECFGNKRDDGDRMPRKDFGNRGPKREFTDRNDRHAPQVSRPIPPTDDIKKQLGDINSKLDRLVSALEKLTLPKPEVSVVKVSPKKVITTKILKKKVASKKVVIKKNKK